MLPRDLFIYFPQLRAPIEDIILPKFSCGDKLVWINSRDGDLSLKESYDSFRVHYPLKPWCDQVWKDFIPTKFSKLVWRMLQNRLPTNEILWVCGMCCFHLLAVVKMWIIYLCVVNLLLPSGNSCLISSIWFYPWLVRQLNYGIL